MVDFKKYIVSLPYNLKITYISSTVFAFFAHLFVLTNIIHNHDSTSELPKGYGAGLMSGR